MISKMILKIKKQIQNKKPWFKMLKRLTLLYLDLLSIPGVFMNKKNNAKYHMKYVCPKCPEWRRKMREIQKNKGCFWFNNWKNKNSFLNSS